MSNPLFDELFAKHAGSEKSFMILPDGEEWSYGKFLKLVAQFSHVIVDTGLKPGDRLAVQIEKSPQALAIYGACVQAGVVFLPLNTAYTAEEVAYFLEDSGAKLMICDPVKYDAIKPIANKCNAILETLAGNGEGTLIERTVSKSETFETVSREADDLAAFLYTSGTTGRSKGAMLTQQNLLSNTESLYKYWHFTAEDVLLHALPIFHTHGLFVASNIILKTGARMIFLPRFDQAQVISLLPQASTMMGVPTFYTRLLNDDAFTKKLVSHMRLFISGSAPLLAETHVEFEARTGHRILERYGMTETNMNTSNPYDGERRAGTVGFPLPGVEVKITDPDTGDSVEANKVGLIEVRGDNVFKGYWQMPEKTKEELRENGFFITGDLGKIDSDGYIHIVGRNKDLIISGGYNIYPKELELVLDEQEGVLESAAIGVAHPDFGETVVAVLVPKDGETPDIDSIQATMKKALAGFKQPRHYEVINELPRNTMGKVQKNFLRERFKDLFK